MNNKSFSIKTEINNFKSYFARKTLIFETRKPITVIAGPNGEGKSNLLDAILFGIGNFISKSSKLRKDSSFTKNILIRENPDIPMSFHRFIFTDILKFGFKRKINFEILPKKLNPKEFISYGAIKGNIDTIINCKTKRGNFVYGKSTISYSPNTIFDSIEKNKLDHLDLIYINSNDDLLDLFVKYVGQEYTKGIESIQGKRGQTDYYEKILNYFPNEDGRLIQDIDSGRFEEKYSPGKFGNHRLPTGAKKECLLYAIGILKEKHKNDDNWMSIFLIDEFESGLHITRKKMLVDSLIHAFKNDELLRNHIRIILTTHSPVIYSELQKYSDLVDVNFVLREPNKNSVVYNTGDDFSDQTQLLIEKKILSELGLNIYSLPNKILFVEGPTDKLFFSEIFQNVFIQPLYTYSLNKPIIDFIKSFPIARSKEYYALVDKNGRAKISKQIISLKELLDDDIKIDFDSIKYNSLEELIFDVDVSGGNVSTIWNNIEKKIESINNVIGKENRIRIDIKTARKNLESKDREGLRIFLNTNFKGNKKFWKNYSLIGKLYKKILSKEQLTDLQNHAKLFKLKMR